MSDDQMVLTFGMEADTYPLSEKIILRSGVASFESQVPLIPTFLLDRAFLSSITFGNCNYGACDCPIYPFVCAPRQPFTKIPTAAELIAELHISNFQSEHIVTLDTDEIPYPGYHPGTKNDEIHTDPDEQYMFARETITNEAEEANACVRLSQASHQTLRSSVLKHHLFYALLHDKPQPYGEFMFSNFVLLFAIGVSLRTGNLIGAVSYQACHNLCD